MAPSRGTNGSFNHWMLPAPTPPAKRRSAVLGRPPADLEFRKSGYGYFALEKKSGQIVRGEEPEYEEATVVASSFEALGLLARAAPEVSRWA